MARIITGTASVVRPFGVRTGIGAFLVVLLASAAPQTARTGAFFPESEGEYLGRYLESVSEGGLLALIAEERDWTGSAAEKVLSGNFSTDREYLADFYRTDGGYALSLNARDGSTSGVYEWGLGDLRAHEFGLSFTAHRKSAPPADFRSHARWYRLDVINGTEKPVEAFLELDKHFLSWFDLFSMNGEDYERQKGSYETPIIDRSIADDRVVHPLLLDSGKTRLYFRLEGTPIDTVPIRLWTPEGFHRDRIRRFFVNGCVFTATMALAVYALVFFLSLGERGYLFLSIAITLGLISHSAMSGLGFALFWPGRPDLGPVLFYLFHPLATAANLLFCRTLLDSSSRIPILDRSVLVFIIFALVLTLTQMAALILRVGRIGPILSGVSVTLDLISSVVLFFGILVAGGRRRRRRGPSDKLLALAVGFGILSYMEYIVSSMDIIPLRLLDFLQVRTLGFALVTVFAMAAKIRTVRIEIERMRTEIAGMLRRRASNAGEKNLTDETAAKVEIVRNYIDMNYAEILDRSDLASSVGLSPDHLGRMFKKLTGETIAAYITDRRIAGACRRLVDDETKVADVAFEVGFESLRTFNKAFAASTGMSPSAYRSASRSGAIVGD